MAPEEINDPDSDDKVNFNATFTKQSASNALRELDYTYDEGQARSGKSGQTPTGMLGRRARSMALASFVAQTSLQTVSVNGQRVLIDNADFQLPLLPTPQAFAPTGHRDPEDTQLTASVFGAAHPALTLPEITGPIKRTKQHKAGAFAKHSPLQLKKKDED